MNKCHFEVVASATEQLRNSGRFDETELLTYCALMQALHEEAALEKPNMQIMATLGQGIAELTTKVDPHDGLRQFIVGGELRAWITVLDDNVEKVD